METLRVTYRLRVGAESAEARAEQVAREQTVEVPRSAVVDPFVETEIMGRVEAVEADPAGGHLATIAYPAATTAFDPSQLLNVLFGNASLFADIECVDAEFPLSMLPAFQGPRHGIAGLRKVLGHYDRPLTCTAVKPMGLSPVALAELCAVFARAGVDVIKDDHGLANHAFCGFESRVTECLAAVNRVADESGHLALYAPNLNGTPDTLYRQLDFAQESGARAVLISPMLVGLPVFWELCNKRSSVPVIAHPSFSGGTRIAPELILGKIFRLFGADAVIFLHFASRFPVTRESCERTARHLTGKWGGLETSLPIPAGGISLENVDEALEFYGDDTMLLVGGSLQEKPDAILERASTFVAKVRVAHTTAHYA
jgi:ribulose-bisphosphate carboxylase large chain